MNRISAPMKDPREFSLLFPPCEDSEKAPPVYKWRKEPSSECNYPGTPDLQKHPLITLSSFSGVPSPLLFIKKHLKVGILGWVGENLEKTGEGLLCPPKVRWYRGVSGHELRLDS